MNELQRTKEWFEQAIPSPTIEQATIQLGCHMEEFNEMLWSISIQVGELVNIEESFKSCEEMALLDSKHSDKKELLDSLADQIVTAVGVAHMFGFDILGALSEINRSNFSKFEDGKPVFDDNGKITKGKNYTPPQLSEFVGNGKQ